MKPQTAHTCTVPTRGRYPKCRAGVPACQRAPRWALSHIHLPQGDAANDCKDAHESEPLEREIISPRCLTPFSGSPPHSGDPRRAPAPPAPHPQLGPLSTSLPTLKPQGPEHTRVSGDGSAQASHDSARVRSRGAACLRSDCPRGPF